jgi:hypothetical protein
MQNIMNLADLLEQPHAEAPKRSVIVDNPSKIQMKPSLGLPLARTECQRGTRVPALVESRALKYIRDGEALKRHRLGYFARAVVSMQIRAHNTLRPVLS